MHSKAKRNKTLEESTIDGYTVAAIDGTLHNSLKIYIPAFKKAYGYLVEKGYANHRVWKDDELSKWLGYNSKDMWNLFMNAHRVLFNLDQYFEGFYCTEAFGYKPKYKIFNTIKEMYKDEFIVVGDRDMDIEIALKHNLKSIGCTYGFGRQEELAQANHIAYSIEEVEAIIERYNC